MTSEARRDEETRRLAKKHSTPIWLPLSIFVGTSLAVGLPIFMFRRARATAFKMSLDNPSVAPPRRASASATPALHLSNTPKSKSLHHFRPSPSPSVVTHTSDFSSDWDHSPSILTAISKSTSSNALLAGKAFLIATTLVGIGAFGVVSSVQHITGASTVPEFARLMRYWTDKYLRPVTDRIHRPPESEEERKAAYELAAYEVGRDDQWKWEEAEMRLKKAYDQGGFSLWAQVALRELEAEARVERARRNSEVAAEVVSRSQSSSS